VRNVRATELVIGLAVFVCFIAVALLDYGHQRRQVASFDSFSSFDYQRGGYRAWFEMLRNEGVRAARFQQRPVYLNDSVATLIVANNEFDALLRARLGQKFGVYEQADLAALRRWVQNGGRLVWLVDQATSLGLSETEITRQIRPAKPGGELQLPHVIKAGPTKNAALAIAVSPLTDGVHAVLGAGKLRIPFNTDPALAPLVADRAGTVVGSYPLGKGEIIVVTDESLFENGRLASADNARLAYNLAAYGLQPGQTVAFEEWSHGYQSGDTWWAILPQPFRVALCIGAAALLFALLGATWRFGPALVPPANDERTSSEYLTSVAMLLERAGATRTSVKDLAQIGLRSAARSAGLPDDAKATAIAERLRGTETGDRRADDVVTLERLAGFERPTKEELVRAARLSLDLRKDLGDGLQHLAPRRSASRRSA
jgi:hypothetical protein